MCSLPGTRHTEAVWITRGCRRSWVNSPTGGVLEGERKATLLAGIPVGRNGRVEDVADLITFLCREETGYVTGATYDVNGGSHIH